MRPPPRSTKARSSRCTVRCATSCRTASWSASATARPSTSTTTGGSNCSAAARGGSNRSVGIHCRCNLLTVPETRYAASGVYHVAFQVMGNGPVNLVYVPGWVSHLEIELENGLSRRFYESLASFTRLIRFDKRGTGLSDRAMESMSLDQRMDDIRAVMDAAQVPRASIFGYSEGGTLAAIFAAKHPERVDKLVLFASHAGKVTG